VEGVDPGLPRSRCGGGIHSVSPRVFLRVVQPWSASLWLGPQARANESGAVAFMVEIDGQEPSPHATLQDAMYRVEGYETPTGAIFYTPYGAHQPVVVYRDGDVDIG